MAKDGTNRGGARVGAGKRSKALALKVLEGKVDKGIINLPELQGEDIPPVKEFMQEEQKDGIPLGADKIYAEMWKWLQAQGCESLVNTQLIEQYSMTAARWIQCERAISKYGMLGKHPTTGAPMTSPYVSMSRDYMKQLTQVWYQIYGIVKEYGPGSSNGKTEDPMELLMRAKS